MQENLKRTKTGKNKLFSNIPMSSKNFGIINSVKKEDMYRIITISEKTMKFVNETEIKILDFFLLVDVALDTSFKSDINNFNFSIN